VLHVAEVRVETAGGNEQEARLRVLSLEAAREMQQCVFERNSRGAIARPEVSPPGVDHAGDAGSGILVKLGLSDLVAFGLAHNRGGIVIGAAIGAVWEMNVFNADITTPTAMNRRIANALWAEGRLLSDPGAAQFGIAAGVFFGLFVALRLLSIGWSIATLYRFTLTLAGDELRTSCGLFTRVNGTIPLNRIQLLTVKQAPLQRWLGRVEVRVETAGGEKGASVSRQWLAPALRRERIDELLAVVMPGAPMASLAWHPVDPRAQHRLWRKSLRIGLGLLLPIAFVLREWPSR
jgi:putative membrane protein